MKAIFIIAAVTVGFCSQASAQDGWGNPSNEWNGHIRFPSANEQQVNLNRADMIEREKGGYYDQWTVNQTVNSTTNNYGDTNIDTMNNSNAIGSQVVNTVNVEGDHNNVGQDTNSSASTDGNTGAQVNHAEGDNMDYDIDN